jgi:hypothetical protein
LLRLLGLKEQVEDPCMVRKIHDILVPQEFTRLDDIVDVLFSAAEDIKQEVVSGEVEGDDEDVGDRRTTPVAFHDACVARIEKHLGGTLVKQTHATFSSPDSSLALVCVVSREHRSRDQLSYSFVFHPHQKKFLAPFERPYIAFGCGSAQQIILIPFTNFVPWLDGMSVTQLEERFFWHVSIFKEDNRLVLHRRQGQTRVDLSGYSLPND